MLEHDPKKLDPDLIRGGSSFAKIMLTREAMTALDHRENHVPRKPVKKSAAKARTKAAARATARKAAPVTPRVPTEHDRFDYSPIIDRPRLSWPNEARVAVWVIPNIEHFLFDRPSTRLTNLPVNPDVLNYSWRDYGVRVGIWQMMEVMERYGVKGTVALNSDVCARYPRIIEEGKKVGWEWMGHGNNNSTLFAGQSEAEERALIKEVVTTITQSVGKAPRGWLSPALSETMRTLDILAENGIEYVGNWVNDDQPYPVVPSFVSISTRAMSKGLPFIPMREAMSPWGLALERLAHSPLLRTS